MDLPPLLNRKELVLKASKLDTWKLIDNHHLVGIFKFENFSKALEFTVKVGAVADDLNHHPEINLSWGRVEIIIFTHDRSGLTELDFQFASRVSELLK